MRAVLLIIFYVHTHAVLHEMNADAAASDAGFTVLAFLLSIPVPFIERELFGRISARANKEPDKSAVSGPCIDGEGISLIEQIIGINFIKAFYMKEFSPVLFHHNGRGCIVSLFVYPVDCKIQCVCGIGTDLILLEAAVGSNRLRRRGSSDSPGKQQQKR